MNGLRAVTAIDEQRAEVLALWRNRFSTATTRRTMWSALISVTRTIHRLPRNAPADPASPIQFALPCFTFSQVSRLT